MDVKNGNLDLEAHSLFSGVKVWTPALTVAYPTSTRQPAITNVLLRTIFFFDGPPSFTTPSRTHMLGTSPSYRNPLACVL